MSNVARIFCKKKVYATKLQTQRDINKIPFLRAKKSVFFLYLYQMRVYNEIYFFVYLFLIIIILNVFFLKSNSLSIIQISLNHIVAPKQIKKQLFLFRNSLKSQTFCSKWSRLQIICCSAKADWFKQPVNSVNYRSSTTNRQNSTYFAQFF